MSNPKSIIRDPNHEYTEETNKRKYAIWYLQWMKNIILN